MVDTNYVSATIANDRLIVSSVPNRRYRLTMYQWLITDEAQTWLKQLSCEEVTPALASRLRKDLPTDRIAPIMEQLELRRRGVRKFSKANEMLFTRLGLEQATDEWIANYKARRFLGKSQVIDICSGIGGDLLSFAKNGLSATGIDRDPASAFFSAFNANQYGNSTSSLCETASELHLREADAWHVDPDRRASGQRSVNPNLHEPSLDQLANWRKVVPNAATKLAPACRLPDDWQNECELEWISRMNECKQLIAWSGNLAKNQGLRTATKIDSTGEASSYSGSPNLPINWSDFIGRYVYEPDSSIVAAHLIGSIANNLGLSQFSATKAYLTADSCVENSLIIAFQVEAIFPFQRKKLGAELQQRGIGSLELKCRGLDVDLPSLRKKLKLKGSKSATLILTPDANNQKKPIVILCKRV